MGQRHACALCNHQASLTLHEFPVGRFGQLRFSPSLDGRPRHATPALMLLLLLLLLGWRQAVAALVAAGHRGRLLLLLLAAPREAELRGGPLQRAVVDHEVVLHS